MSILVGSETRLVVQGITGREGEFHSRAMLEYGTPLVAGVTPGKGGQMTLDGRVPVFDTMAEAVAQTGANASCIFVPGRLRARRHARGGGRGRGAGDLHHRGCAGAGHAARLPRAEGARRAADRAELPGRHHGRRGQGGDHPRLHPSARLGGPGQPLRHPDLRGRAGHDRCRHGPVDLRRHRGRPDHRHQLHRRAGHVQPRPADRGDRA